MQRNVLKDLLAQHDCQSNGTGADVRGLFDGSLNRSNHQCLHYQRHQEQLRDVGVRPQPCYDVSWSAASLKFEFRQIKVPSALPGCSACTHQLFTTCSLLLPTFASPLDLRTQPVYNTRSPWVFQSGQQRGEPLADRVLTNRLQFPAGRSVACGCQRASPLPFICWIISRRQACVASGWRLTNQCDRTAGTIRCVDDC